MRPYSKWKKKVMDDTDKKTGTKIAIRFENVKSEDVDGIKRKLNGIDEKYIEYAIRFISDGMFSGVRKDLAITFDRICEFPIAINMHRRLMNQTTPDFMLPIWVGGHMLFVLVEINDETKPLLVELRKKAKIPKKYDGIKL